LDQLRKGFKPLSRVAGGFGLGSDRDKQQRTGEDESAEHAGTIEREGLRLQVSDHQKSRSSQNPEFSRWIGCAHARWIRQRPQPHGIDLVREDFVISGAINNPWPEPGLRFHCSPGLADRA
jgi:hypothetical protein